MKIPSDCIQILLNYLENRKQCVKFHGQFSKLTTIISGVPQGSILGPMLFNFFVRDLKHNNDLCRTIKYADDTTILVPHFRNTSSCDLIKNEMDCVKSWCLARGLALNTEKTKVITISNRISKNITSFNVSELIAKAVTEVKLLGVHINSDFTWNLHFDKICKIFGSRLSALRTLKNALDKHELMQVYNSLLGSLIDYACPVFMTASKKNDTQVNRAICRAHKIICGNGCRKECLGTVQKRRNELSMRLYKIILSHSDHILNSMLPPESSHSKRRIIPHCTNSNRLSSFEIECSIQFNNYITIPK